MSGAMVPVFRHPGPGATQVGMVRVVKDRKRRYYIDGAPVQASVVGDFTALAAEGGRIYYVRTADLARVPGPRSTRA